MRKTMNNFKELQDKWKNQSGVLKTDNEFEVLLKSVKSIERKQKIMNVVLTTTILILIFFLFYVSGYKNTTFLIGIALMIGSLIFRIAIEKSSIRQLKKINFTDNYNNFKEDLLNYYRNRKRIHFVFTPLSVGAYVIGFSILLPLFKATLSNGFYLYILVSSVVLFIIFTVLVVKQIKKELLKLGELQLGD